MNSYAEHTSENVSHASAHIFNEHSRTNASVQQIDNRPATAAQRKFQEAIQNNFQAKLEAPSQLKFNNAAPIQMMRPHIEDIGRDFLFTNHRVAVYLGPVEDDETRYRFSWHDREIIMHEDEIVGYRPTVGRIHPPNQIRPPEENVKGRSQVFLSEGDLSGGMSLQRENPELVDDMVVTTFEEKPDYPDFEQNLFDLESLGVPFLPSFDISKSENSKRLENLNEGGNIHFQMPRVPRSVKGYSTQKLVGDTLSMPKNMGRDDLSVSITTPDPSNYKNKGVHDRFYGLENEKYFEESGMSLSNTSEDDLYKEEFGYTHKQSTIDKSAEVSETRKKYFFISNAKRKRDEKEEKRKKRKPTLKKTEHEDFHNSSFFFDDNDKDPPPMGGTILNPNLEIFQ